MEVRVWFYKKRNRRILCNRQYRFFIGSLLTGHIEVKGNKKVRLPWIISKTKLEKEIR